MERSYALHRSGHTLCAMDLDAQLRRPHLEPSTRLLVLAQVAIWPADWARLDAVLLRARELGCDRAHFEESLLQAVLFFGFPRLVSAFERLQFCWPIEAAPQGGEVPPAARSAAGRELFTAIYGKNDAAVRALLASFHQAFHDFVLEAAYGRILARPGLPARTRELLAVGALAALHQLPQLVAHGRGALSFGASADEIHEAMLCGMPDDAEADECMRRIRRSS
jgi:4-carboxymuconolactone decarboxylase